MAGKQLLAFLACCLIAASGVAGVALAADPPSTWDGLIVAASKTKTLVYLAPEVDFSAYHKVQIDPTEVAFERNWARDYNRSIRSQASRLGAADLERLSRAGRLEFMNVFTKAYAAAGYEVVTHAGPDVLRVRTALIDVKMVAPDLMSASRTFSVDAGEATLVLEARDSVTGAILARAIDRGVAGGGGMRERNRVTNRADFRRLFVRWAKRSSERFAELKSQLAVASPTPGQ